ncbi:uncharacterized protein LOC129790450 [Lutzomyia longipalpis]|nr:uncharacterized protein LOC129790450 [Lutzomyia longipalpis]
MLGKLTTDNHIMNNKVCVLYFLFMFSSSIIRATLYDLLHFIERGNIGGDLFDNNERQEKNLTNYYFPNIKRNEWNKYSENLQKHTPFGKLLQQAPSIPLAVTAVKTNIHNINGYKYQNRNPPFIFIEKLTNNLKQNYDYKSPFSIRNKPTFKFFGQKFSSTAGLDVNIPFTNELIDKFKDHIKAIYPGTLWCGGGDLANGTSDLGFFASTDNCCKMHDMCPFYIKPRNQDYGLQNSGLFTRSHCDCDREFYYCLKKINTFVSNKIGYTYFNILGPQCFREEYPIISCAMSYRNRCYSYIVDDGNIKTWQWFDNKLY